MNNKLLIITRDQQEFYEGVVDLDLTGLDVFAPLDESGILELIPQADIILANPPLFKKYVNGIRDNIWVQSTFAGIDALVGTGLKSSYTLTNMKNVYGPIMSEYVFAYILLREKNVLHFVEKQKNKEWDQFSQGTLEGKTIGFLGTGSIAQPIAKIAKAFGMQTKGLSYSGKEKDFFDKTYDVSGLDRFCDGLDYLVNVLPSTDSTFNFIDRTFRGKLPNKCYFINVGRGTNVNEIDIVDAINTGKISGASLDVFHQEPLAQDSELWSVKNINITPHVSGYTKSNDKILEVFSENYNRYLSGQELLYKIDFSKGY